MHSMDRANHHEYGGRTPRKRGLADQQPGGRGTRSQQLNEELGLCRLATTHASCIESA
jgi:hypothetical protein